jgi:hypothetical protein
MKIVGFVGILAIFTCSQSQVPVEDLKIGGGKDSVSITGIRSWKNAIPKKNNLSSAQAIAKVRQSFKSCKNSEEAYKVTARWLKPKYSSATETCAAIEALYHLKLRVGENQIYLGAAKTVWTNHLALASPEILEHARQAVLMASCFDIMPVSYPVRKTVFDVYQDDPAMAFFWRRVWISQNPPNKSSILKLIETIEYRRDHQSGLILDEMLDAKSSAGQMTLAAAYGWSLLHGSASFPNAKGECLKRYRIVVGQTGKSKPLSALVENFTRYLKGKGWH